MTSTTMYRAHCLPIALAVILFSGHFATAQTFDEKFEHWPVDLTIKGTIIVDGGGLDEETRATLYRRAKDKKVAILVDPKLKWSEAVSWMAMFQKLGATVSVREFEPDNTRALLTELEKQDLLVIRSSDPQNERCLQTLNACRAKISAFLERGGLLSVDAPLARALSKFAVSDNESRLCESGVGILPDCAIATDYDDDKDRKGLLVILAAHPRAVGIGISRNAALILTGRKFRVVGEGKATFLLMANEQMPLRVQTIAAAESRRQPPEEWMVDLTEWRRDAIDRTLDPFPPAKPEKPVVENGTLVIVGGGGLPKGLMEQFVEYAGGKEKARIVYVPCSESDDVGEQQRTVEMFKRMGVENVTFIHTKDRNLANSDETFLAPLKDASGIWFGGGRQWNFADSYYGTQAHKLMKDVLKRGGVIGGSSAGASIQGRYLARATPIGNFRIMAPGYERGGLGFLDGVAIDQHFSQRGRQKDMTQLVNRYPQLLGIGIDETTAIIVQKSKAQVVGRGKVFFYDRNLPVHPDKPDYVSLPAGSSYDLAERKVIRDATPTEDDAADSSKKVQDDDDRN